MNELETGAVPTPRPEKFRLADGRFAPGNRFGLGRGNPQAAQVYELKQAILDACTPEALHKLTLKLMSLCEDADPKVSLAAMELLFNRLLGKPKVQLQAEVGITHSTAPTMDLTALSDAELDALMKLTAKAQQAPSLPPGLTLTPQADPEVILEAGD